MIIMKKIALTLLLSVLFSSVVCAQSYYVCDTTRVYDVVKMTDTCYLHDAITPCFMPWQYDNGPACTMAKEFVANDTVTVYGVAYTIENRIGNHLLPRSLKDIVALLFKPNGDSPYNPYARSLQLLDSVTFNRAHPRFCWFLYEDPCDVYKPLTVSCYELYFDTPMKINKVVDTFYVGRHLTFVDGVDWPDFVPKEYGGEYSYSLPSYIWGSRTYTGSSLDFFFKHDARQDRKWGVVFPIINLRCGEISESSMETYGTDSIVVRWRRVEENVVYGVRLVGSDGSDIQLATSDTSYTFSNLIDTVSYQVLLRKQCVYYTSNYDTTVYGEWVEAGWLRPETDTTGITTPDFSAFTLTPNPAHGSVHITLPPNAVGRRLTLCDIMGREMMERRITATEMDLDISLLRSGPYIVRLETPRLVITRRLLVE